MKHSRPNSNSIPSPIPTGRGTRSASNEPFARFLERATRVPALSFPGARQSSPAIVHLSSPEDATSSAREFGVFLVNGHDVSAEEMRKVIGEFGGDFGFGNSIIWNHDYPSEIIKTLASKLKAITEDLRHVLLENVKDHFDNTKKRSNLEGISECVLSLHRFNHKTSSIERSQLSLNDDMNCLSLQIPFQSCQIYVQSEEDHFNFDAGPENLVVTIGKQIQEESEKEFKCISGKMIFVPAPEIRQINDYSFLLELKLYSSLSSSNVTENYNKMIISLRDQIIVAILITLLYKIFIFLIS